MHAKAGWLPHLLSWLASSPAEALWSAHDSHRAALEGWHVFAIDGVFELGAVAHPAEWFGGDVPPVFGRAVPGYRGSGPVFASDEEAWRHVAERARGGGGGLHRRALDFLASRAPEEREAIRAATGY